jgi:hypothetical protein
LLLRVLVYLACIHLDFLRFSKIFPKAPQALPHRIIVIQRLNEALSDPSQTFRDEVILAIIMLSSEDKEFDENRRNSPFKSPLITRE